MFHRNFPMLALAACALFSPSAHAVPVTIDVGAAAGADGIFVHWLGVDPSQASPDSMRLSLTAEPFAPTFDGAVGVALTDARVLPLEATISDDPSTGKVQLTRFKTAVMRATLMQLLPAEVLTFYRDLDRGIQWGGDLFGLRVPIRITSDGSITISPGMDLGVRHYSNDTTGVSAAFVVDAKAVQTLIQGWLDAGILARAQYDVVGGGNSGDEESAMGFLSLALDSKNQFYMRVYGGVEHDSNRANLGMPTGNTFVGAGIFGNFKGN